jgi:GT2 family glycosyltransferase
MSVIIPLRPGAPRPRSLEALESSAFAWERFEVFLAWGECPSRQRNLSAQKASGDLLLFLDDDSVPAADLIDTYREIFRKDPRLAAVGGPAVYRASNFRERLSAAALSEPLVTGKSAARYAARGPSRASDERELILSNLAVRRAAFEAAGGFDESLYPNEENLLLERLRDRGGKIRYEPSAIATRPAPRAGVELLGKVYRYCRGRAAQARRCFSQASAVRVVAAFLAYLTLFTMVAALPWTSLPLVALSAFLIPHYSALLIRISRREGFWLGICAPLAASGIHLAYAAGILAGFLFKLETKEGEITIEWRAMNG